MTFRARIGRGERLVGLAATVVRSVEIVTIARGCGFDWLMVDTEHTALGVGEVATMTVAAAAAGFPALVRVGGPDAPDLARMLDLGATGIVVPHVDGLAEAERVVARARFAPHGRRSIPGPQAGFDFRSVPVREMTAAAEARTVVVLMIEGPAGLADADAMAALDGVDALMIGANDLADGLGHAGDVGHPAVRAACASVAAACRRHRRAYAVIGLPEELLGSHGLDLGASLVIATNDVNLMMDAGTALAARLAGARA